MHDIDRTQFEAGELASEYAGELEQTESDSPLHETQELELASALLEVSDEMELEAFLGDVFRAVGHAAGRFARSGAGRALGGILKDAVGQALPGAGGIAQQAGSLLGLELEGLSPQDQEFETARQLVRFTGNAYRNAVWAPRNAPAPAIARAAALAAARRYAPGLLPTLDHRRRGAYRGGWQGRPYGSVSMPSYRTGSRPRYGSGYGMPPWQGRPSYSQPGYDQPAYRHRRRRQWYPGYPQPWYPAGSWADDGAEDPAPMLASPVEPSPPPPPIELSPPPPIVEPAPPAVAAEPAPAAAPPTSSELEWGAMNGSAARRGRWVRRDGVLIVYGA